MKHIITASRIRNIFQEVMEEFGLNPKECLMVGNDVQEDLTIRSLGVKTYLLTDTLENKKNIPLEEVETEYRGTMEELYECFQSYFCSQLVFIFKHSFITLCVYTINCSKEQNNFLFHNFFLRAATSQTCSPILLFEINFMI